jgi:superoxide dismutase, Fe-Mn family
MAFTLPNLPYPTDALAPHLSKETLEFHHGKHHGTYVTTLNRLVKENSKLKDSSLEEILKKAEPGPLFNNAAQHWNHSFYWTSMKPKGGGHPTGKLADAIKKAFGDFEAFKKKFIDAADGHFGSGWAWLVQNSGGNLVVEATHDADNPFVHRKKPLLTCDVWEHAYYIDYRNERPKYVEAFVNHLVNWDFASANFK